MTYTILGRAIPKQYLSMGTLATIAGVAVYSRSGKSAAPKSMDEAKNSVPLNAGSKEEEELYVSLLTLRFDYSFDEGGQYKNVYCRGGEGKTLLALITHVLQTAFATSSPTSSINHTTPTTPNARRSSSIVYNPPRSTQGPTRSHSVGGSLGRRRSAPPERSPAPVTLADRHKDLLEFIAQKEAKVLELRSQLAAHENELLQLKRKWERIVSRGFTSHNIPSVSGVNIETDSSITSPTNSGAMLDGIREGVQGVGRLIAAFSPTPYSTSESPTRHTHSTSSSTSGTSKSTRLSQSSTSSIEEESSCADDAEGQVLMVHDTGATPTMSPNPAFNVRRHQQHLPEQAPQAEEGLFDFAVANATSIHGATPASGWVGTVGKKWEELQRVPSVAKNTKRASLLFSDIASALQGVTVTSSSPSPSISSTSLLDDDSLGDAMLLQAPALTPAPVASLKLSARMVSNNHQQPQSLLPPANATSKPPEVATRRDDSDDEWNW
ncbi:hypothetical protein MIND_01373900 [Mycena indigotica]|uniref:Uncharacterized protein n=1 Tax=Mycena indigotica TaxID=2126181 RepID=A0A8H6RZQ8_9AGAR|nr:uncharacterized protein MIND_01373900 [Mycena indigotica]KAF7289986.1 hypothetical protein MIND_01373900 [Mycena indigotica]